MPKYLTMEPSDPGIDSNAAQIARWIAEINHNPDPAHGDFTPAVHGLVSIGLPAARAVLELLMNEDEITRLHAQRVLEGVTRAHVAARTLERSLTRAAEHAWQELWAAQGSYAWDAPDSLRLVSVQRWHDWLDRQMTIESQGKATLWHPPPR